MLTNDIDSPNVHAMDRWRRKRIGQMTDTANMPEGFTTTELPVYTPAMTDITREEFNAKLETIEVKMDARVEAVSSKIEAFLATQAERDRAFHERDMRLTDIAEKAAIAAARAEKISEGLNELSTKSIERIENVRTQLWWNFLAQVLAVVAILVGAYFANQANVQSAISSTVSIFQAGQQSQKDATPLQSAPASAPGKPTK